MKGSPVRGQIRALFSAWECLGRVENNHLVDTVVKELLWADGAVRPSCSCPAGRVTCFPLSLQVPEEVRLADVGTGSPMGTGLHHRLRGPVKPGQGQAAAKDEAPCPAGPGEVAQVPEPAGRSSGPGLLGSPMGPVHGLVVWSWDSRRLYRVPQFS